MDDFTALARALEARMRSHADAGFGNDDARPGSDDARHGSDDTRHVHHDARFGNDDARSGNVNAGSGSDSAARGAAAASECDGVLSWSDDDFSAHALDCFRLQFATCAPYRAYCERRGATPDVVARWQDVPHVPANAFKYFDFVSGGVDRVEAVFETSGTTKGEAARGRHHVPRLELYRASCLGPLRRALLPEGRALPFVSLVPPPEAAPDSSLSFMVGAAADAFASETRWLVDGDGAWVEAPERALAEVVERGEPVLVVGTALAFLHLTERLSSDTARRPSVLLPEGTRVMETGGFKGVRRDVSREELYQAMERSLGVPRGRIVNEYGMTELLSQLWETTLTDGMAGHLPPPWLRVRALDPNTLAELPEGEEGLLVFFDLANLGSVSHVLTEDVGAVRDGRVLLRGRAVGSEPRGCSRAMDELMAAAERSARVVR